MVDMAEARRLASPPFDVGRIVAAGHLTDNPALPQHPLRVLGTYCVAYVLSGTGRYTDVSGLTTDVTPGGLIVVLPDVPHWYGPPSGRTWNEMYVLFEGPVFDLWRRNGPLDPAYPIRHLQPIDHWAEAFGRIIALPNRPTMPSLVDVCRLQLLLAEVLTAPLHHSKTGSEDEQWLAQATALLEADSCRETSLQHIAAELAMSYDGFRKRFRYLAGISPARYRSQRSIDRACELMVEGILNDREIAVQLGYCNEFHFSHRFRELTGRSPRQFRAVARSHARPP